MVCRLFKNIYISVVIYIFRGNVRAYIKGNEMLFEIIYMLWFCGCGISERRCFFDSFLNYS